MYFSFFPLNELRLVSISYSYMVITVDLKEIDVNLLEMKEELGCGQFGVSLTKIYIYIYIHI